jgi:hypothetical protein
MIGTLRTMRGRWVFVSLLSLSYSDFLIRFALPS